jgi:hypothetical protein
VLRRRNKIRNTAAAKDAGKTQTHPSNIDIRENKGPNELGGKGTSYQHPTAMGRGEDVGSKELAVSQRGTTQIGGNPVYEVEAPVVHELYETPPIHELQGGQRW